MEQGKITINNETVKGLTRTQLENVLFAVYNDNIAFKKKIDELEAKLAELQEFKRLANAEKYTPSSEAIQGLFPELEAIISYSEETPAEQPEAGEEEKRPRKPRKPNLVLPADVDVAVDDRTKGVPDSRIVDGIEYRRGEDQVIFKLAYTPCRRKVIKQI